MSGRSARSNTWRFSIPVAHLGSSDEPQWPHAHASCRTARSGSATCSKVPPSWPVWPPLALPERPRRLPGMRGFFFNPSLEGGLELSSCPAPTGGEDPPLQRGDQLFDFGRENHPNLDSDSPPVVSENPPTKLLSTIPVTFRTHPATGEIEVSPAVRSSPHCGAARRTRPSRRIGVESVMAGLVPATHAFGMTNRCNFSAHSVTSL